LGEWKQNFDTNFTQKSVKFHSRQTHFFKHVFNFLKMFPTLKIR